jgi:hypothetical protein
LIAALVGGGAGYALASRSTQTIVGLLGAVVVGFIGYKIGEGKAFALKLQAQTALCQVRIEENTGAAPVLATRLNDASPTIASAS